MQSLVFLTALAASVMASPVPEAAPSPIARLGYASFKGFTDTTYNVTSWEGMYYAADPSGTNRWAPPIDIEKVSKYNKSVVYDATSSGPICFQQSTGWNSGGSGAGVSEDCLLLNVRKPLHPASSKLPVIVNIHGGGYNLGSASGSGYTYFVSVAKGEIMYVEIQYRLGGLGFLNSKEVQAAGTANAGLLDQRSAIGWVQRHIAAFGGDPDKISIIGGSAGGGSVTAQLQLFGGVSKPPFRAAIAEYPWWQTYHTDSIYEKQYNDLLAATGCKNVACLRSVPYATLTTAMNQISVAAYQHHAYGYGDFYWGPGVDGKVIKDLPHVAFTSGRFSKVPMLINHDADEGWPFTNWTAYHSEQDVTNELKILWPNANQTFFSQLEKLYPTSSFSGNYFATPLLAATAPSTTLGAYLDNSYPGMANDYNSKNPYPYKRAQIFGDSFVSCGTRTVASSLVKYGLPVYKLIFNSGTLVHGAVDGVLDSPAGANEVGHMSQAETQVLQAYFISFMADLNPNTNAAFANVARPQWTSYGTGANVLYDNFTKFGVTTDSDKSARCQLMYDYGTQLRN